MSLKDALVFEIVCCDKELEDAIKKVKNLRKRLKYLKELLNETDKPYDPKEDFNG